MKKFKPNPLAASVITGVTAQVGGIEPASVAAATLGKADEGRTTLAEARAAADEGRKRAEAG